MIRNLFEEIPAELPEELFNEIAGGDNFRLERIVSRGQATPSGQWYDQDEDEWVILLQGRAVLSFKDGQRVEMRPGDHLTIPAHRLHRVEMTAPDQATVWLALHYTRVNVH